jgi:hypothetical protein
VDNNFSAYLISDDQVKVSGSQLSIEIRLPWYRALPLSTVEIASIRVNGADIAPALAEFELNGKIMNAAQLADLTNEWWYVLDGGRLSFAASGITPGQQLSVDLTINLYPPYMPGLIWVTQSSKRLRAH